MKKTLLFTLEYPPQVGGVANFYHELVRHNTTKSIVVLDNINNQLLNPWVKSLVKLHRHVRKQNIEYILVGNVLPLGTVAWAYSLFTGTPYKVFIHGMDITVPQQYWRKRVLLRWILRRANTIFTVSHYTAEKIKPLLTLADYKKIHLLPPGPHITPECLKANTPAPSTPEHYILSIGRLVERKGFDNTIIALAQLPQHYQNTHYVIAGSGVDKNRLLKLAQQHGVAKRVHIYEKLSDAQVAQLYQRCLFVVAASRVLPNGDFEGFGITVLEANAFGKPTIVGEGGMSDAVIPDQTGLIVQPATSANISAAMEKLLANPAYAQQLGEQAKLWVEQEHDWVKKVETLMSPA